MLLLAQVCASVPDGQQPFTHYQILGISPDEQDPRAIEEAALGRAGQVRAYQLTSETECTRRLNEIAQALITLLDPVRRREYDRGLHELPGRTMVERQSPRQRKQAAPVGGADRLLTADRRTCDVKLVHRERIPPCP
jgi:hypothetical protein